MFDRQNLLLLKKMKKKRIVFIKLFHETFAFKNVFVEPTKSVLELHIQQPTINNKNKILVLHLCMC